MIQILKHFGWTWAGLLISDDDYGLYAARSFQSDFVQSGEGCLAYLEVLPWGNDKAKLKRIVDVVKKSSARVVIVFALQNHIVNLMGEVGLMLVGYAKRQFICQTEILKNNKIWTCDRCML